MYGNQTLADKVRPHLLGYLIPTFAQNKTKQVKGSTPKGTQLVSTGHHCSAFWVTLEGESSLSQVYLCKPLAACLGFVQAESLQGPV